MCVCVFVCDACVRAYVSVCVCVRAHAKGQCGLVLQCQSRGAVFSVVRGSAVLALMCTHRHDGCWLMGFLIGFEDSAVCSGRWC